MSVPAASPPRLYRASSGRWVAGVALGVAEHLGLDVRLVRGAFVLLALAGGAGIAMYGALWLLVPEQDAAGPVAASRYVRAAQGRAADGDERDGDVLLLLGLGAVAVGAALLLQLLGLWQASLWPVVVIVVGAALVWQRADAEQRARLRSGVGRVRPSGPAGVLQVLGGVVLVVAGSVAVLLARGGWTDLGRSLLGVAVALAGVALLAGPWALRLLRERDAERTARIRGEERAELAAQVHDSVLQTLTMIQRHADDPREVGRLARGQERELRRWLYAPQSPGASTLAGALQAAAGEVEDTHGATVEVVCVGDLPLDERVGALVQAAREAIVNAAKYAGRAGPVAVYAEVDDGAVTVYVRDRGAGFALDAVPLDRLGVRQSIIGRMERNGGSARVRSGAGRGTEVELALPRLDATQPEPR